MRGRSFLFVNAAVAATILSTGTLARTLEVGAQHDLKVPSEAAALVNDGDHVLIDPGDYTDCAIWRANNLVIEGEGDVTIRDRVCQDKGIFVIYGSNVTIRAIEFAHARSTHKNGAGIRSEGTNLAVEKSRFVDNENGILTADNPQSHIVIQNSVFMRNGKCDPNCAHGIYIGRIALLQVSDSEFFQQYVGHHIKSRALRTEVVDNSIKDGTAGTASYEVDIPDGGSLVLRGNVIEKGPGADNRLAAVSIGEESNFNPTGEVTIAGNIFSNDNSASTAFVRNMTATTAALTGNIIHGKVVSIIGPGVKSLPAP